MNRLTEHHVIESGAYMACSGPCDKDEDACGACLELEKIVDRLAAYEDTGLEPEEMRELLHDSTGPLHKKLGEWIDAEQEGRLLVLPCKVGDMVYFRRGRDIIGDIVERIVLGGMNQVFVGAHKVFLFREFGKTVFLTREDAEKALEGMDNDER